MSPRSTVFFLALASIIAGSLSSSAFAAEPASPEAIEFFERNVRPVLAENCYVCHGPQLQQKGLRMDSREAILQGGSRGPALVPGDPVASLLLKVVRHQGIKMPPAGKLADNEIASLEKWISTGAAWPLDSEKPLAAGDPDYYERLRKTHWSFQPVRNPPIPEVRNAAWSSHPIDRFLLAKLEQAGLSPAAPADRHTLVRRLSFILTGLPPTPAEVEQFVADESPRAYERLVGRLLGSPQYGEHWARHWMDVMRFAETLGNDWNYEVNGAWHYRDYLIRAFNSDVPYDQLVREHIAGDLLDKPRINTTDGINESLAGLTFYRLGEQGHDDCLLFREVRTDVVDNQIDTLGKAFQGLTVACARCHDHKLDPIPTKDYYALYSVLSSSRLVTRTLDTSAVDSALKQQLRDLKPQIKDELAAQWLRQSGAVQQRLLDAFKTWKAQPRPEPEDLKKLAAESEETEAESEKTAEKKAAEEEAKKTKEPEEPKLLFEQDKVAMDDPLFPWLELDRRGGGAASFQEIWAKLGARYRFEADARARFNREYFQSYADFRGGFGEWHAEGQGLLEGASPSGAFSIAPDGPAAVSGVFPAGIYTHALSEKLNGALRSPYLPQDKYFISLQVMGGKLGAWRATLDNCMLSEDYDIMRSPSSMSWVRIPTKFEKHSYASYVEVVTKHDNPRLPDRPKRLEEATPELLAQPRSYFGIARAVVHDCEALPEDELTHMGRLFEHAAPRNFEELASAYSQMARQAIQAWAQGTAADDDVRWIDWLLSNELIPNSNGLSRELASLVDDYRQIESRLTEPRVVYGMADLDDGFDSPLLKRGDPKNLGDLAPRGFLGLITKSDGAIHTEKSGRRELADFIASPENPLTARVMANRIWHYLFGRGIVSTTDNFGRVGEKPSHPELLDYLATRLTGDGWSIRRLIKHIVMTEAFRQSGKTVEEAAQIDPENRLIHHHPTRRLDAESIRDSVLATSGRLDRTLYGPSTQPYRENPQEYRKLFSGPLDGDGRRSIYIKVTRHEGDKFLGLFDFPEPGLTRGRRDVTNVPGQSLALLNDPFVYEQAGLWAGRVIEEDRTDDRAEGSGDLDGRIAEMFRTGLGRQPDSAELARLGGLVRELASLHNVSRGEILDSHLVWKDLAHSIINMKEFIYIR
jgi:mono/diheme cytochrome c family protein